MNDLTDDEIATLEASRNEREWNAACDAVKRARGGRYPDDWLGRVMLSGLAARVSRGWKAA